MTAPTAVLSVASRDRSALDSGLRKARWRILPLLSVCYLVAYMDRTNISFAAETMNRDLHFTAKMYGLGAGLFFLTYALCEIPSNAVMLRFGARRWLARIMLTWGLIAAAMMFVRLPVHFYGARLLLGCAEAGYFPGALYYLSQFFPQAVRARAISLFYLSLPLSTLVMGGLAGALLGLNGRMGLAGWQWMFLLEAVPALALAFAVWFGLPDSPASAKWLEVGEKQAIAAALAEEQPAQGAGHEGLVRVLRTGRAWALGLAYFFELGTSYALVFSLPIVLTQLTGWNASRVGYLVALSGVLGVGMMVGGAWLSDRSGRRRPFAVGGFLAMGTAALVAGAHLSGWPAVVALLAVTLAFYWMQGPMLISMTTLLPGRTSAMVIAFTNTFGICGGFVGPYWMGWMREATGGYAWGLGFLCVPCFVAAGLMAWVLKAEVRVRG